MDALVAPMTTLMKCHKRLNPWNSLTERKATHPVLLKSCMVTLLALTIHGDGNIEVDKKVE